MLKFDEYNNMQFFLLLGIMLGVLLIIRIILLNKVNKKDLEIAKNIIIGKEEIQEDYLDVISTSYGTLAIVADGLGKNEAGKISSIIAVKTITNIFKQEGNTEKIYYFFKKAFNKTNHEILKRTERDKGGASVLSVLVKNNLLYYALVGDVMLAVFRDRELVRLSEGHAIGEVAKREYYNGKIEKQQALCALKEKKTLYYLGQESFQKIEIFETPIKLEKHDIIVLMSRGIYESLRWIEIEKILASKDMEIKDICDEVVEKVQYNDFDNCNGSIILMKYLGTNFKSI